MAKGFVMGRCRFEGGGVSMLSSLRCATTCFPRSNVVEDNEDWMLKL